MYSEGEQGLHAYVFWVKLASWESHIFMSLQQILMKLQIFKYLIQYDILSGAFYFLFE